MNKEKYESALPKELREQLDKTAKSWLGDDDHATKEYEAFHWGWKFGFLEALRPGNIVNYSEFVKEVREILKGEV